MQGYLFSEPTPIEQVPNFLQRPTPTPTAERAARAGVFTDV